MNEHTRRGFLALGAGVLGTVAGCVGGRGGRGTPPGTTTRDGTGDTTTDRSAGALTSLSFNHAAELGRIDASFAQRDVGSYYLGLLASDAHAAAFPTERFDNREAARFVTETDYSAAAVVVLQDRRGSSHPDLELREATLVDDRVHVATRYPGKGGTADVTTDTLLVRVRTGDGGPTAASAAVTPQYGGTVRFSTRNVYERGPTFDAAGDLVFRNRDCAAAPLSVTVTRDGELFFADGEELPPASARRVERLLAYPGEWTVAVDAGSGTTSRSWALEGDDPGDVLVEVAGDGSVSLSHAPEGVDSGAPDACETDGYPYESSSPAENLDHPVDLWVIERSPDAHRVTVTIRDGETQVFGETFETRVGDDKIKRAGLLAKKTDYAVEVTTGDGSTVTETVTVEEGVKQLTVMLDESGTPAVTLQ